METSLKTVAEALNSGCACKTLDSVQLKAQLERDPLLKGIFEEIVQTRPNLFSSTTVFLSSKQLGQMAELINTIEAVIKLPAYQKMALLRATSIATKDHGPKGIFMGYDFHLSKSGPKLIEINTNAGGALLNLELAKAQQQCCISEGFNPENDLSGLDKEIYQMFLNEWKLQRSDEKLKLIAIVDDDPEKQYLYPEFQLFEQLFASFNTRAIIVDAKELQFHDNKLWFKDEPIDMVYNRLTDFYLEEKGHQAIRSAYESGSVVLTPSPNHHALYANKLNLVALTDENELTALNLSAEAKEILLHGIPRTEQVLKENSETIWENRKNLFFKPISGFGGKAAYRGDKITHKVWDQILSAEYVSQKIIPPSERLVQVSEVQIDLKVDIRVYVYEGHIQLLASRLYAGQTTNFRTTGGGFAPVFIVE